MTPRTFILWAVVILAYPKPVAVNGTRVQASAGQLGVAGVVENVNSFLSGIRATFRQDNVIVTSGLKLKPKNPNDESEK